MESATISSVNQHGLKNREYEKGTAPRNPNQRVVPGVQNAVSPLPPKSVENHVIEVIKNLCNRTELLEKTTKTSLRKLKPELRGMLELQLVSQRIGLESNLMVAAGEAISGTVKRLQQMSGS